MTETNAAATAAPNAPLTVALDAPSAQVLADQAATIQDLQFVMECCKRLLTELARPEDERDSVVPLALWSAALIAYGRCFGNGKRFGLTADDVRSLPLEGEVMKFHKWVIEERKRHTTHSANPFEAATVAAALSPPDKPKRRVTGIAVLSRSHVLVDDTGVRQLGGLASELAKQTADKAQAQQDVALVDAGKLPVDRLYELPPLQMRPPADDADEADAAADPA
jgi:hypothetical protein